MTIAFERTRSLVETKRFLESLLDPAQTRRVPRALRARANALLRHYPTFAELEAVHLAIPGKFGPVSSALPPKRCGDRLRSPVNSAETVTDIRAETVGRKCQQ